MLLAKVMGTVVSSQKHAKFQGMKLFLIQPCGSSDKKLVPQGGSLVAVDCVTCGVGDLVLFTQGSSARMTECTKDSPVDAVIIGIVDAVEVHGKPLGKP
ncbi:MAG: EutN/CcmL family microcompartment protein [Acidobacteriota bacterium]|nr:EutN/CcmL family microcompartment protein [Acidobacteriota bacterium]